MVPRSIMLHLPLEPKVSNICLWATNNLQPSTRPMRILPPFTKEYNPRFKGGKDIKDVGEVGVKTNPEVGVISGAAAGLDVERANSEPLQVGGRLAHFKNSWMFSSWAHSIVSKGLGWSWVDRPPRLKSFFQEVTPFLKEYVQDLLARAVIKKAKSLKFQGRLFCVPKKDSDKKRVILDLSVLNQYIRCEKFRMLTISQIRTLLPRGAVTISIDLTDAYWHIPIARCLIPYLGFKLGYQAYTFRDMPFGLNIAPRVFTK